jgi:hypothetical protein
MQYITLNSYDAELAVFKQLLLLQHDWDRSAQMEIEKKIEKSKPLTLSFVCRWSRNQHK